MKVSKSFGGFMLIPYVFPMLYKLWLVGATGIDAVKLVKKCKGKKKDVHKDIFFP